MKVKQINLDDEGLPENIVVRVSRAEAAYIALLVGRQTGETSGAVMPGGAALNSSVYEALAGDVFNRFYENGVEDAAREPS